MSSPNPVSLETDGQVSVIRVHNPLANALTTAVRANFLEAIQQASADPNVLGILILSEGHTFNVATDVTESPLLAEVTDAIENCAKPVAAGISGPALGGIFEIALACHYRVAESSSKIGFPEVKLGLMPGAGGTQRLPRLIGTDRALKMIAGGEQVSASTALEWGAVDEICEADIKTAALAALGRLISGEIPVRRVSSIAQPAANEEIWANAAQVAAKKYRNMIAPQFCIRAIQAAEALPFMQGLKRERELFLELRASPQASALRHAFLGEREAAKTPWIDPDTPVRAIETAAVIGAGTMGSGIAMCFANSGIPVILLEAEQAALDRGTETIRRNYAATVSRGDLSQSEMNKRFALIRSTLSYEDLNDADILVEAVFEDIDVKKAVFAKIDAVAKPGAVLATNTSYLSVRTIAEFTRRQEDVVGTHFFSPANQMRLLENVRGPKTAPDVLATVMKLGKALGKVAVLVGDSRGFVGNRMLGHRTREAYFLLEEGALPQQVDKALVKFGFPMGPFAVGDLAGLDIGWRNRKATAHLRKSNVRDCNLLDKVCEMGRLGQKTGAGWYRYEKGSRAPIPDPIIEKLINDHFAETGFTRRSITDQEIIERCLYSMINESAAILAEGVAARPVDIDMVWLHGYAFPAYRGGPMYYADQIGLGKVLERILAYRDQCGSDFWEPAPLLVELSKAGKGFYSNSKGLEMQG